jgi:hypothetical protein
VVHRARPFGLLLPSQILKEISKTLKAPSPLHSRAGGRKAQALIPIALFLLISTVCKAHVSPLLCPVGALPHAIHPTTSQAGFPSAPSCKLLVSTILHLRYQLPRGFKARQQPLHTLGIVLPTAIPLQLKSHQIGFLLAHNP